MVNRGPAGGSRKDLLQDFLGFQTFPMIPSLCVLLLQLALRCSVDAISFSAHADFPQTSDFLDIVNPPHVILVHGEAGEMMRLKRALEQRAKATDRIRNLYTPKVTQPVHIRHAPRHIAKVSNGMLSGGLCIFLAAVQLRCCSLELLREIVRGKNEAACKGMYLLCFQIHQPQIFTAYSQETPPALPLRRSLYCRARLRAKAD